MKKTLLLTCLLCSALILSACASAAPTDGASNSFGGSRPTGLAGIVSSIFSPNRSLALTPAEKLAIGTIRLDANGQAIDGAEAAKLLPLWQLLHQLYASSSAAPQEEAAVVDQIRSAMTPSQVASIDSMQMSRSDIFSALQQGQANASNGGNGTARTGNASGARGTTGNGGNRGQGFFFGGGPAGGFGGGFGGGGFRNGGATGNGSTGTATTQQTLTSTQRAAAATSGITNALINQVISLLQDKVSS